LQKIAFRRRTIGIEKLMKNINRPASAFPAAQPGFHKPARAILTKRKIMFLGCETVKAHLTHAESIGYSGQFRNVTAPVRQYEPVKTHLTQAK
jgi:hypothetical protein